jgi:hypothetical protein
MAEAVFGLLLPGVLAVMLPLLMILAAALLNAMLDMLRRVLDD